MKVNKAVDKRTQRNSRQPSSSTSSARVKAAKDKARRFGLRLQGSVREGVVVVLLALCVFLLLALFSYQAADPGWSYQGPETDVRNWMGPVGAWLADVLYSLLGASALWWPSMFGYAAWWLMRSRQVRFEIDPVAIAVHAGGLVLLMFGTTMLGALHFYSPDSVLPYASGGILGEGLVGTLKPLVSSGGVGLIAAALILIGFPLFSGMSWLQVADEVGRRLCKLGGWVSARRAKRREKRSERAAVRAAARAASQKVKDRSLAESAKQERDAQAQSQAEREQARSGSQESTRATASGRSRLEPSFSAPLNDTEDGPASTTDTSIPWGAAAQAAKRPAVTPEAISEPSPETASASISEPLHASQADAEGDEKQSVPSTPAPREDAFALRTAVDDEPRASMPLSAKAPEPSVDEAKPDVSLSSPLAEKAPFSVEELPSEGPSLPESIKAETVETGIEADIEAETEAGIEVDNEPAKAEQTPPLSLRATRNDEALSPASKHFFVDSDTADAETHSESRLQGEPAEPELAQPSHAKPEPREPSISAVDEVPRSEPGYSPSVYSGSAYSDSAYSNSSYSGPIAAEPRRERVPEVVPEPVWEDDDDDLSPLPAAVSERHEPTFSTDSVDEEADNGPTLWTVEHLQSQRPAFETQDEPEGDVPSLQLLTPAEPHQPNYTEEQLGDMAELLEVRLREYGVKAEVVDTWPGPVITRFEIKPAPGVKVSKISNLAKDLARSLMVKSVRVVEVIPGRPTVGIEIPNPNRAMIRLREVIDSDRYQQETSPLTMALGQDIGGSPVVANLGKMPHLLVAGTTGSGKSVGVNAMLISMLLKAKPDELKLIMVDPKMLELSVYDGIPHLLAPVVTDMKEAANSLRWCVAEMERRYKLMAAMGVRNIAGFNGRLDEAERAGAQVADPLWEPQPWEIHQPHPVLEKLPYIVVVIDEFADMFMIVGKKVEELIARLAQKARAAGIHLILATQRPSVDVVTGLIKANIPSRMAFQVSSRIDSRTILDQGGAESLLGHGDMLYLPAGSGPPNRVHGAFVDDDEVHRVVDDWKRRGEPEYIEEILSGGVSADALTGLEAEGVDGDDAEQDALYDEAVQFVTETRKASISAVQRRFKIGYNRAARLVEAMEGAGVVSSMGTNGAREVLAPPPVGH